MGFENGPMLDLGRDAELFESTLESTRKALETWEDCIGEEKLRRVIGDYSGRPGYTWDATKYENVYVPPRKERPDGASVSQIRIREKWDGGGRVIRAFSDGETEIDFSDGGVKISTTLFTEKNAIHQKTVCDLGRTRENAWRPLIAGEEKFFKVADPFPYDAFFSEEIYAYYRDGRRVLDRYLITRATRRVSTHEDRYVTTLVTSSNGLVEYGSAEHGISLVLPKTHPVEEAWFLKSKSNT